MKIRHASRVRLRAFQIWQKLGFSPWAKPKENSKKEPPARGKGDFYRGAFDSIPFLNDDAKRTFTHLLFRPGYMIRDYLHGQHDRYLAPLTSLIIFYAFFALVSSIVRPEYPAVSAPAPVERKVGGQVGDSTSVDPAQAEINQRVANILKYQHILSLDKHPEEVDTPWEASLAAVEGALRSRGIYLFLADFLLLWAAMTLALRKRRLGLSAAAATSAYVLCQFSFFMLFSLLITWGKESKVGLLLMAVLLVIDYRQLFGETWKGSLRLTLRTGIWYALVCLLLAFLLVPVLYLLLKVV